MVGDILMHELVSVVVPAYNAERSIGAAITSVLQQTYGNFEVVIVDDASTDRTVEVIRSFDDGRISLIEHSENRGAGAARDTAIAKCRGDWIAFLDADDAWAGDRLEKLLSMEPSLTGSYMLVDNFMRCYEVEGEMRPWKSLWNESTGFAGGGIHNLEDYLRLPSLLIQPIVPRDVIIESGLVHSSLPFGEDAEFYIRLIKSADLKFKVLPEPLYHYRLTPGSLTALSEKSVLMKRMFEDLLAELEFTPGEQKALAHRIAGLEKSIDYMPFIKTLQQGDYVGAIRLGIARPSRFLEFLRRLPESLYYRFFLLLKGGQSR